MSKKILKINLCFIILFIFIACTLQVFAAASFSVSKSSTTITEGKTDSFTINGSKATGRLDITSSNTSVATVSTTSQWIENNSATVTITAKKAGTATITISGTVADTNGEETTITKKISVTVKAKATNTGGNSNTGSSSNNSSSSSNSSSKPSTSTTTAPKFTSVSQTVYATENGINVRSSYSTSSSALGSLKKGESLKRTGIATTTINGIKWSKVIFNGQTAYVSSAYLTTTKPVVEEPKKEETKKNDTKKENTTNNEILKNETNNNEIISNTNTEKPIENNEENNAINTKDEDLKLSKLEIAGVSFTEGFNSEIYSYTLQLNFFVKDLNITAVANQIGAQVEIIGNENFEAGENNITILVTSADNKETVTYQIKVIIPEEVAKSPQNDIQLYVKCGGIILIAIIAIIIITIIYKSKNKNELKNANVETKDCFTNLYEEGKTKKEKVKGGKHSN